MRAIVLAFRMLRRTPFVTTIAILSLGLGIGANTAVFSLFNQILMRPLPVPNPDELVNLSLPGGRNGSTSCNNSGDCDAVFSYPMLLDLVRDQQVFTGIGAHWLFGANVGYQQESIPVDGDEVSGDYFNVLGIRPARGRLIGPADNATIGAEPVVVLSHDYWITRFKQDEGILGQRIVINGTPFTIIGVTPEGFDGITRGTRVKVFVPMSMKGIVETQFNGFENRSSYWAYLFGRLKPGVTMETAGTNLNVAFQRIRSGVELPLQKGLTPDKEKEFLSRQLVLGDGSRGQSYIFSQAATPLTVLQAVTVVVLLIACANIANLLLARGAGRATEMAVRLSIGASRGQLIRQLLLESCLLAGLGGIVGLVIMDWTTGLMTSRLALGTIDPAVSHVSLRILLFAAGLSIATGVLFGVFPALHATRPDLASTLKNQAGQPSGAKAAAVFRRTLVVVQIALSMGLLTTAGLFAKSLFNVSRVDLGVDVDRLITFRLDPQRGNGYSVPRAQTLFQDVMARLAALPGVTSVAVARVPLIGNSTSSTTTNVEGYTPTAGERTGVAYNEISPAYFKTTGMAILAGRDFTDADVFGAPKVAIVNEAFAKKYNLAPNPVGRRMRTGDSGPFDIEIVGLVRDAKYNRVREAIRPVFFLPYRQNDRIGNITFYAKTAGDPASTVAAVRPLVVSFDPNLPVQRLRTMTEQIADNVSNDTMMSTMSATFAGLATALAALGLYGVLAYTVSQRTREFGLRMALGADPRNVQRLVLRQVIWMTISGGAIGLGLAIVAGYYARAQLFEMASADPMVLSLSLAGLTIVALAAGFIPSRRASRVDPMRALRWE